MIIYCTVRMEVYEENKEKTLLKEMGVANWILACSSSINKGEGGKYYFYKTIDDKDYINED